MLLFEEFFKKKKIDLGSLQQSEPGLFSEFKEHYEQMGEKSFDHTKKFWFNKLRHQFPLPPEVKAERLRPENQIAEQTVSDMLTAPPVADQIQEGPKPGGFKPRFKPGVTTSKPAEPAIEGTTEARPSEPTKGIDAPQEQPTPVAKVGFKPRFKAGMTTAKPAEEEDKPASKEGIKPVEPAAGPSKADASSEETASTTPKMGFKPRFKAGVTNAKPSAQEEGKQVGTVNNPIEDTSTADNTTKADDPTSETAAAPKMGFKPRFKAGVTNAKLVVEVQKEEISAEPAPEIEPTVEAEVKDEPSTAETASPAPKMGFKPRFKAGVTTTKPADESPATDPAQEQPIAASPSDSAKTAEETAEERSADAPAPKLGFKPRFKSKPADEQ